MGDGSLLSRSMGDGSLLSRSMGDGSMGDGVIAGSRSVGFVASHVQTVRVAPSQAVPIAR